MDNAYTAYPNYLPVACKYNLHDSDLVSIKLLHYTNTCTLHPPAIGV